MNWVRGLKSSVSEKKKQKRKQELFFEKMKMEKLKLLSKPNNVSLCKDIRNLACVSEAHCTQKPEENIAKNVAFKESRKRKINSCLDKTFNNFKRTFLPKLEPETAPSRLQFDDGFDKDFAPGCSFNFDSTTRGLNDDLESVQRDSSRYIPSLLASEQTIVPSCDWLDLLQSRNDDVISEDERGIEQQPSGSEIANSRQYDVTSVVRRHQHDLPINFGNSSDDVTQKFQVVNGKCSKGDCHNCRLKSELLTGINSSMTSQDLYSMIGDVISKFKCCKESTDPVLDDFSLM